MKNVLIVDDHGIVRTGVKLLLKEVNPNLKVFTAAKKEEAFAILKEIEDFSLIILDINIPNYSCERMIEYCKIKCPSAKIMILSMNAENMMARRYYQIGVDAYVNKGVNDETMKDVFQELLANKKYYSPEFLKQVAEETFGTNNYSDNPFIVLSQREFEVMQFLIDGKSIQETSNILSVHPSTIGTYKSRIFEKLKVDNLIDLYTLYVTHNQSLGK